MQCFDGFRLKTVAANMRKSRLQTFENVIFSYMCNETCLQGDSHTKLPAEEIIGSGTRR